jgi:hypothetical protein
MEMNQNSGMILNFINQLINNYNNNKFSKARLVLKLKKNELIKYYFFFLQIFFYMLFNNWIL